jgi:hypothetical protein
LNQYLNSLGQRFNLRGANLRTTEAVDTIAKW